MESFLYILAFGTFVIVVIFWLLGGSDEKIAERKNKLRRRLEMHKELGRTNSLILQDYLAGRVSAHPLKEVQKFMRLERGSPNGDFWAALGFRLWNRFWFSWPVFGESREEVINTFFHAELNIRLRLVCESLRREMESFEEKAEHLEPSERKAWLGEIRAKIRSLKATSVLCLDFFVNHVRDPRKPHQMDSGLLGELLGVVEGFGKCRGSYLELRERYSQPQEVDLHESPKKLKEAVP